MRVGKPNDASHSRQLDAADDGTLLEVKIVVTDVLDEWPKFDKNEYVTAVDADASVGTMVLQVNALVVDVVFY